MMELRFRYLLHRVSILRGKKLISIFMDFSLDPLRERDCPALPNFAPRTQPYFLLSKSLSAGMLRFTCSFAFLARIVLIFCYWYQSRSIETYVRIEYRLYLPFFPFLKHISHQLNILETTCLTMGSQPYIE